jgi:hypothetical protein
VKNHITLIPTPATAVAEAQLEPVRSLRSELDARLYLAAEIDGAFRRVPAPLVARALDRGRSSTYALSVGGCVGGLRAYELLLAPRPWAVAVTRGILAQVDECRCGAPSRLELVRHLALAASLVSSVPEDLSQVPEAVLRKQAEALRESERSSASKAEQIEEELRRRASKGGDR